MSANERKSKKKLSVVLTLIMLLAMLAGPGPGLRLINPDISDPGANYLVCGIPVVYAWGLFWYAVQIVVVLTAYFLLWKKDPDSESPTGHERRDI